MNSNTFQDQPGQPLSYKFGSLSHTDPAVRAPGGRAQPRVHRAGRKLGARSHTVWIGDGGNFPGQVHFRKALERYLESLRAIYAALPDGFRLFIEHKLYEPAFYSTVLNDWGMSYYCARELGERAFSLVDLGHHAPNVNIEMIVARLIQFGKLAGFHFNDSKYGDDDLDAGSIKPFQLFLVFNELVDAELEKVPGFDPAYMLDQSHNVTDPLESLMTSAAEVVRAYVQAHLVDRARARRAPGPQRRPPRAAVRSSARSRPTSSRSWPWRATGRAARSTRSAPTGRAATGSGRRRSDRRPGGSQPGSCSALDPAAPGGASSPDGGARREPP